METWEDYGNIRTFYFHAQLQKHFSHRKNNFYIVILILRSISVDNQSVNYDNINDNILQQCQYDFFILS